MKQYHTRFEKKANRKQHNGKKHSASVRRRKKQQGDYIPKEVLNSVVLRFPQLHEEILKYVNGENYRSQKAEELADALGYNNNADDLMIFLQMLRKMELDYAVSYTHLTLPTICSV